MKSLQLTTICAITLLGLMTGCGGAGMSGAAGTSRKEKQDDSGRTDASTPAVVTGAYLTCNDSPEDSQGNNDAVGCSMIANGATVTPTPANKLAFYRSKDGGPYQKPDKSNTASGHQALFYKAKTETAKTRYIATYANQWGVDEISCNNLPCNQAVKIGTTPEFLSIEPQATTQFGAWSMDSGYISTVNTLKKMGIDLNFIEPDSYCDRSGIFFGSNPGKKYIQIKTSMSMPWGATTIESSSRFYAQVSNFSKKKLKDGSFYKENSYCIVVSLKTTNGSPDFYADEISQSGAKIRTDQFHLVLTNTSENLGIIKSFLNAIPD